MQSPPRIYLASTSPRRRELLNQVGVRFDLVLFRGVPRADTAADESVLPGEAPEAYACRVAGDKARHGADLVAMRRLAMRPVLAADTTLDVDGEIVGKPRDAADAVEILLRLSGRSHRVITAVALTFEERFECVAQISEVRFRDLGLDEIRRYVATGEPMDKAGAYGIQGRAGMFIAEIRGSFSGIAGLPLCETVMLLRRFGYPA